VGGRPFRSDPEGEQDGGYVDGSLPHDRVPVSRPGPTWEDARLFRRHGVHPLLAGRDLQVRESRRCRADICQSIARCAAHCVRSAAESDLQPRVPSRACVARPSSSFLRGTKGCFHRRSTGSCRHLYCGVPSLTFDRTMKPSETPLTQPEGRCTSCRCSGTSFFWVNSAVGVASMPVGCTSTWRCVPSSCSVNEPLSGVDLHPSTTGRSAVPGLYVAGSYTSLLWRAMTAHSFCTRWHSEA